MGEPAFVVLPITTEQDTVEIASAIQHSLHEKTHPEEYKEPEHTGPLKQIIAHQDSLYKYISWEDPIRTLGSYIGALSVLFGAHYLPLTHMALKAGIATLGVVSVTEYVSRSFGPDSLSTRLRPKEYKKIPEPTLNATLKDIHDLIQYAVVQAQRIIFGQDLDKTFAAFLGFTALYWLIKVIPLFGLAVIGLTSLYIAPLVTSPRGRPVTHDASVHAQELGKAAAENGKAMAAELSSKARQTTVDTGERIQSIAQSGKQTAADLSARASGTASDVSGAAAESVRKLPQMGTNAINKAPDTANSALGNAKQYISSFLPTSIDRKSEGNRSVAGGAADKESQLSNSAAESARRMAPGDNAAKQSASDHLETAVSSLPGQTSGEKTDSVADRVSIYSSAGDADVRHGIIDRPRGAALSALDGA